MTSIEHIIAKDYSFFEKISKEEINVVNLPKITINKFLENSQKIIKFLVKSKIPIAIKNSFLKEQYEQLL